MSAKRREWARYWPLPLVAMLGITGPAAYTYSGGIFMGAMIHDFGWTRTEFASALTLQMLLGLIIGPVAGRVLDLVGPRRMLLAGIVPFAVGLSLLGMANGALWQWWLLAALYSFSAAGVIPAAWASGAVRSFDAGRGLALAFCLAGIGVATAIWPMLVAWLVETLGWRLTFPAMAFGWAALLLPLTYFFYKPAPLALVVAAKADLPSIRPVLRTRSFWCLLGSGGLFASVQLALIIHFVPILRQQGLTLQLAASLAGITGLFSIAGRISTGLLLDWVPIRPLALFAFTLPIVVMSILVSAHGSIGMLSGAAVLLGFASGSETDIVAYLCSRKFDPRLFGSVYSLFQTGFAIFASLGPLLAGWQFDRTGNYHAYYLVAVPIILLATSLIMLVPVDRHAQQLYA